MADRAGTGQVDFWTSDTGIDVEHPVDLKPNRGAVHWMLDHQLISPEGAQDYADRHPDPDLSHEQSLIRCSGSRAGSHVSQGT
jgi:hypothetical protein